MCASNFVRVSRKLVILSLLVLFGVFVYLYCRTARPVPISGLLTSYPSLKDVPMIICDNGSYPDNVTVVTAFINIGSYMKGPARLNVSKDNYLQWMTPFRYMTNPLVVYTDTPEVRKWFESKRTKPFTKIIEIHKEQVWPFEHLEAIQKLYSDPNYPKHIPNTVFAPYPCSQHAKYGFVEDSISRNYFHTNYFAWVDIGYFRGLVTRKRIFRITTPPSFNTSQVAFNMINSSSYQVTPEYIFRNNIVRCGGGFFIGTKDSLRPFIHHYKSSFVFFLTMNLCNTDQQLVYSMYTESGRRRSPPPVEIQEYVSVFNSFDWFYLGYLCLREHPTQTTMQRMNMANN